MEALAAFDSIELDLDGLKMLVDSSTGSLVVPSDCTWLYLIDSSPWYEAYIPSTGDTLSGPTHHFSQTSLTLWPPDPADRGRLTIFSEVLLHCYCTITCSFYFAQERQEGNFTAGSAPRAKPDKVARSQRPLQAHERRKLNIFLVRSLRRRLRIDRGPEVDHVRSTCTLKWHFPLCYRSTRPCPMCSFTFWFSVSSLESVRLLLRLYLRKDIFSARRALDLRVSSSSSLFFFFFFFWGGSARLSRLCLDPPLESVLCLACSQFWRPSWRHCSWERCQSDIHSKMFAPRCFRLRMWAWLSL